MSKRKWNEDELDYFVQLYKNHECLWNVRHASYFNQELRHAAFADIAQKMLLNMKMIGLGVQEIKDKLTALRTSFYHKRNRAKHSTICPSERYGKWYKEMEYIVNNSKWGKLRDELKYEDHDEASTSSLLDHELTIANNQVKDGPSIPIARTIKFHSRIEIMNVLKKMYQEKVAPTFEVIFDILTKIIQNDDKFLVHNIELFKIEMTKLGYFYKENIYGKKVIVENPEQRFERYLYLSKIKKIRGDKSMQIVYLDERIINSKLKFKKFYNIKDGLPPESSIFFHAVTKDGFLKGIFSNQATPDGFNKWVTDLLLGSLKAPCVIVMDSGPLHGTLEDTCPIDRYSTKTEMVKWLNKNNIPYGGSMSRPELFELIRKYKKDTKEYKIDRIFKCHGHKVLRLPTSFPDINMTDILWNTIADGNTSKILLRPEQHSLQFLQNKLIEGILPSISKPRWHNLEKLLTMKEFDIYEIDVVIESLLETYVFM